MADVSIRDNNTFIQFKLTDYGQELLHNITQPYLGRTVVVKLDEVILLKATVQEELGKYFELTFDGSTERAKEIAVLIESGSLIEPISLNQKFDSRE